MKLIIVGVMIIICSFSGFAQNEPAVEIPNIFTPNGDGVNDLFKIKSSGYSNLKCTIFNRYGESMYVFYGLNGSWDGRTQIGLRCPDGIYFYLVELGSESGETETYQGSLHLISGTDRPN